VGDAETITRAFIAAYAADDRAGARALLADDVVGFVTNAEAGVDEVVGGDAYMDRLPPLDDAELRIDVTQSVSVAPGQALTMVQIAAERDGNSLRNVSAFLTRAEGGRLTEIWMVEAQPAHSDEFWS
jgi:ketosteroid isomerase-like protein